MEGLKHEYVPWKGMCVLHINNSVPEGCLRKGLIVENRRFVRECMKRLTGVLSDSM